MMCVLVIGDDKPSLCDSLKTAKAYFREVVEGLAQYEQRIEGLAQYEQRIEGLAQYEQRIEGLAQYEQRIEASVHFGGWDTYQEYPDYVLSLGPKGGLICERC